MRSYCAIKSKQIVTGFAEAGPNGTRTEIQFSA